MRLLRPFLCVALLGCVDLSIPASDTADAATPDAAVVSPFTPTLTWPPDGAAGVTSELGVVWFAFERPPPALPSSWRGPEGRVPHVVETGDCGELGVALPHCVRLRPTARLSSGAHQLGFDAVEGEDGEHAAHFIHLDILDTPATLALAPSPCALDEVVINDACVLVADREVGVRVVANGPARISLGLRGGAVSASALAARGEAALTLRHLEPETAYPMELRMTGLDGEVRIIPLAITTTAPLPTWTITEVRADAIGPEPAQEYVELCNFGSAALTLGELYLSDAPDRPGDRIRAPLTIAPGGRLLVVSADFDPEHADDVQPAPGVPLVRLDGPIASGGISNGGEPLYLRDAEGRRISAAPALASDAPGECLRRVSDEPRAGHPGTFATAPRCTPGAPEPLEAW